LRKAKKEKERRQRKKHEKMAEPFQFELTEDELEEFDEDFEF
jgi:hypothetical protein